jgi:putative aminopeptidase FrvX
MNYKLILKDFMTAFGPSGYEKEIACRFKAEMEKTADDVMIDKPGNVIARYNGSDPDAPVIMMYAHMDQLGFIIRKIEADGFIQVDRLGGIPEKVLPGLDVRILTKNDTYVDGVFGNKSHHASAAEDKYKVDLVTSLYIDIGAASAGEARALGVDVGCPVTYTPSYKELAGDFISGTAIDNRGGLAALVAAAQILRQKPHPSTIYLVGTVWEEFNLRGAMLAARIIKPDISLSLDVVLSGDTPDLASRYESACGKGPALVLYSFHGRGTLNGTIAHPGLAKLTEKVALEENIPLHRFASLGILSDSSYVQLEGDGVASLELGFPVRYTHTPVETANVNDIIALGKLAGSLAARIDNSFNLSRY